MYRWFGHVDRINESILTKGIYETDLDRNVVKGRLKRTVLDQIEQIFEKI
jgi:hypothetical protein